VPLILGGTKGVDATAARLLFRPDELHLEIEFTYGYMEEWRVFSMKKQKRIPFAYLGASNGVGERILRHDYRNKWSCCVIFYHVDPEFI